MIVLAKKALSDKAIIKDFYKSNLLTNIVLGNQYYLNTLLLSKNKVEADHKSRAVLVGSLDRLWDVKEIMKLVNPLYIQYARMGSPKRFKQHRTPIQHEGLLIDLSLLTGKSFFYIEDFLLYLESNKERYRC